MNNSTKNLNVFLLTILLFFMLSCLLLEEENKKTTRYEVYAIEPDSLLGTLAKGGNDAFTLTTQEANWDAPAGETVNWKQSDYFYIINALFKDIFHDTLEGWNLNSMSFSLGCDEVEAGFQEGRFEFFKVIKEGVNEWETRISRNITIDARYESISILEREHYPKILNWSIINLDKLKIDSAGALQIAEMNIGAEKRISTQNSCFIRISLVPDAVSFEGWHVSYSLAGEPNYLFSVEINPLTGEITRIK